MCLETFDGPAETNKGNFNVGRLITDKSCGY